MKQFFTAALLIFTACSITPSGSGEGPLSSQPVVYTADAYNIYSDRVVQGKYEARALSNTNLVSNYQSPANDRHPRKVEFKFSLNGKDNELPVGVNHTLVLNPVNGAVASPLIMFGSHYKDTTVAESESFLDPNTALTIRLDMSPVLNAFAAQGYYQDYKGDKIYKQDFKGVYVAGNAEPLSWDFENLPSREGLALTDADGDGVYETTITLNRYNADNFTAREWKLSSSLADYPAFTCNLPLINALYNLSLEETKLDIRPDNTFMAGEKWNGVWTRDISYSIVLAMAAIEPEVSKNSLLAKTSNGRIIQDTGTGGSWPVSTDRMTWALAAWEIYVVTGDRDWLQQAYSIISNTAEYDLKNAYDGSSGLFRGESSFLDWRKQSYPRWMGPVEIYQSENLGTNVVHYQTYLILGRMAAMLNTDGSKWLEVAGSIKEGINRLLWQQDRGYYGQYLYGNNYLVSSPRFEALGEALSILYGVAEGNKANSIVENAPLASFGIPTVFPQIPDVPPYHNKSVWPFVQAYWNWAAARQQNTQVLEHGLAALYRQAALFLTNKENLVLESGDYKGTEINSDRQLWSVAGNLAMVYRVFFGMDFLEHGLAFAPVVPKAYSGSLVLSDFSYRQAKLTIEIKGWGTKIKELKLDGKLLATAVVPANLAGTHRVEITMDNATATEATTIKLTQNHNALPTVSNLLYKDENLSWSKVEGAVNYIIYKNGKEVKRTSGLEILLEKPEGYTEYMIAAVDKQGWQSYASSPLIVRGNSQEIEAESVSVAEQGAAGYSGNGYIVLTKAKNAALEYTVDVALGGAYVLEMRYSNGSGPINTDNKCAIRTLNVNGEHVGSVVLPQLGYQEWSNWGHSNPLQIQLNKGENRIIISFEKHNENMNGEVNQAYFDYFTISPIL